MWKIITKYCLHIYIVVGLFFFSVGINQIPRNDTNRKIEYFTHKNKKASREDTLIYLLSNNFSTAIFLLIGGLLSFVFIPTIIISYNAFNLGYLLGLLNYTFINPELAVLHLVLPHAIIEIVAFYWFACWGTKNFTFLKCIIFDSMIDSKNIKNINKLPIPSLLLFIAALIESYISNF
jgi:uncharacterized membrane protein SpoIIM required for sporulation